MPKPPKLSPKSVSVLSGWSIAQLSVGGHQGCVQQNRVYSQDLEQLDPQGRFPRNG